jgi:hypothetical protein
MTDEPLTAAEARERTPQDTLVVTTRELDDALHEAIARLQHVPDDVDEAVANAWVASGMDTARHLQAAVEDAGRNGRDLSTDE